ncbi:MULTISPECIES: hypothetical protein [Nonomuraea]|uniref:LPXTG cell wall anchor domain-containing protein n=1 Tax=Nonomuraea mangrovi TaxID=2316207 RepID=A0ABW4SXN2_9ACTN
MASARRLAAAGAVTAFIVGGVTMVAGVGTAMAADCKLLILACEDDPVQGGDPGDPWQPDIKSPHLPNPNDILPNVPIPSDTWSNAPAPQDTWSNAPAPQDSWSPGPAEPPRPEAPWKPVDEDKHRIPEGPPQTGAGGLAPGDPTLPFAAGGAALLAGAGLAGFAVRRGASERPAAAERRSG